MTTGASVADVSEAVTRGAERRGTIAAGVGTVALLLVALPGVVVLVLAIVGPWIAPHPLGATVAPPFEPPGDGHLFGTDRLGRDLWSQALHGGRRLLIVPLIATVTTVVVGGAVGMTAGYVRGRMDAAIIAAMDLLLVLPGVLVLLVLATGWGAGPLVIVIAMVLSGSPFLARLARAATLQVSQAPFVQVSVTQGDGTFTILRRDVLPNVLGPLLADSGMRFLGALYLVAALSLLGFGPPTPETDWAVMIRENAEGAGLNVWALALPAGMIALLSIAVNVLLQTVSDRLAR